MDPKDLQAKNKRLLKKLIFIAIAMFGFAYLMVPMYRLVCKQVGLNGQADFSAAHLAPNMKVDTSRMIDVEFSTTVHGDLPFKFKPLIHHVKLHPGETKLVYFYAQNNSKSGMTVQAIPSITPDESAKHLKKTQCFCFTRQYFFSGEKADMPVYFYVDSDLPKDINDITLSYTLFNAKGFAKKGEQFSKGRIDLT